MSDYAPPAEGVTTPAPYYQDDLVTLYHGDCRKALASMADREVDVVITDPPYDERTHAMARSEGGEAPAGGRLLSGAKAKFHAYTHAEQLAIFAEMGRVTRRWVVATVATDTAFRFEVDEKPPGLRLLRVGAWIKTNPMPIFSGDRPAMGWEPIVYFHRDDLKPAWNGGGKAANFVLPSSQGTGHPTSKPLAMVAEWVRLFSNPGDTVLDPFVGSGTTLRAAKDEGRSAIGWEVDERYCEIAAKRLAQDTLFGGVA